MMITVAASLGNGYLRFADKVAVREVAGGVKTYAELGREARRLVAGLQARGISHGDRIVLLTQNRSECFTIDHALAIGGMVRVALSYRLHVSEVVEIVADCEPRAVIVDGKRSEQLADALAADGFSGLVIGLDGGDGVEDYAALFTADEAVASVEIKPDDVAWMPYTSGTTGKPKGVMLTHRNVMAIMRSILVELPAGSPQDAVLHIAPLSHLSGYAMLAYFLRGASQIAVGRFDPLGTLELVEKHKVTVLPAVPTMINLMLPHLEEKKVDASSLHTILYGGSAIAPDRLARALRCLGPIFLQGYGATEHPWATWLSKADHQFDPSLPAPARLASAGRVSPFVEIRLVDDAGDAVSEGEAGEIQLRSDAAMTSYWRKPQETREVILEGGWIATGDVGRIDDGLLYIVDRKKDMIVSGGFNIYPTEVENAIYMLPGVEEVAVIGVPSPEWGETVKAAIVRRDGFSVEEADVREACLARLASYKQPRSIEFVDSLPKTGTGKIMRRELRERYWIGQQRMVGGG